MTERSSDQADGKALKASGVVLEDEEGNETLYPATYERNYAIVITPDDDVKIEKVDFNNPFAVPNLIDASLFNVVRHGFVKDKMSSVMVVDDSSYLKTQTNRVGSALYFGNRINGDILLCKEEPGFEGAVFKGYSHRQAESLVKWLEERIQKNNNDFKFNYDPKTERENSFVTAKNPDELKAIVENIGKLLEKKSGPEKQISRPSHDKINKER